MKQVIRLDRNGNIKDAGKSERLGSWAADMIKKALREGDYVLITPNDRGVRITLDRIGVTTGRGKSIQYKVALDPEKAQIICNDIESSGMQVINIAKDNFGRLLVWYRAVKQ